MMVAALPSLGEQRACSVKGALTRDQIDTILLPTGPRLSPGSSPLMSVTSVLNARVLELLESER
jgi:hypothetical protein